MVAAYASFTNANLICDVRVLALTNSPPTFDGGVTEETKRVSIGLRKRFFFTASDSDGDLLSMSLTSNDQGAFVLTDLGSGTGDVLFNGLTTPGTYTAVVQVSDGTTTVEYTVKAVVFCINQVGARCNNTRKCCGGLVCNRWTKTCQKQCRKVRQSCSRTNKCCGGLRCSRRKCRR